MADANLDLNKSVGYKEPGKDDKFKTRLQKAEEKLAETKRKAQLQAEEKYQKKFEELSIETQRKINARAEKLAKASFKERLKEAKEFYDNETKYAESASERVKAFAKSTAVGLAQGALNAVKNTASALNTGIENYLGTYSQYMTGIETRLQGASKSYSSITQMLNRNIGSSQYVSQGKVLQNLSNLVSQGIVYNVEQRAFLQTVSEKIATTFDAFDSNLTRLIKLQQADSTAARLGMESTLNKFFNSMYQDTSYLQQLSDNVAGAIIEANSQLSRNESLAFEYNVQKWLGSLSSVGVSDSTISSLAQGINMLGSGDVSGLSGNSALQNLMVMAANAAGINYADIISGGLNANTANKLLSGLVEFTQGIANASAQNQVVRAQYAQLFGMSVSDLSAMLNLTTDDLKSIKNSMLSFDSAVKETENGIATIGSRMTLKNRLDTMFENVLSSVGEGIANSAGQYITYMLADVVEKATGGIALPTIMAFGSGIDLETTLTGLTKTGIVGLNVIGQLGSILSGLSGRNGLSLDNWNASATTGRGRGLLTTLADGNNVSKGVSQSYYAGTSTASEMYKSSILAAEETTAETVSSTEENEMMVLLRDRIAVDVSQILSTLTVDGIVVKSIPNSIYSSILGV